jgi:hypothetical protein
MEFEERRPRNLAVVAVLMIVFGLAEVLTGFNVGWFARTFEIPRSPAFTYVGAAVGALYVLSGLLVLAMKRWAAALAIVFLGAVVAGRIFLVLTGAYPFDSFLPAISVVIGTAIVVIFGVYVGWRWNFFRESSGTGRARWTRRSPRS